MKKVFFAALITLFSIFSFSLSLSVTDYYDSTFGDYIPPSQSSIPYSWGNVYIVADLGEVSSGDAVVLKITYPDGSTEEYSENCDFDGSAVFYRKVELSVFGNYKAELIFKGETASADFTVIPDEKQDAFEPNNRSNNNFYLERGSIISSLFSSEDTDYYMLKVDTDGVNLELETESDSDLALTLLDGDNVLQSSDADFSGNESISYTLNKGEYIVKIYSPVKEKGDYCLTVRGNFPVYLPLSDFQRGFTKKVLISNLSDKQGNVSVYWYDGEGNLAGNSDESFSPLETKEFEATDYGYVKIYSDTLEINASAIGHNENYSEAIAYTASMISQNRTVVSHVATQTNLYETEACFSFNSFATYLNYGSDLLFENMSANTTALINFNEFYQNVIENPWGLVDSDGEFTAVEMFRLITEGYYQATALTLSPLTSRVFFLPHITENYFWWTGISIVNPNNGQSAVDLIAFDSEGNEVASSNVVLEPMGKTVGIVGDYFENGLPENAVAMKVVSDMPVQVLYLFGTKRGEDITEDVFGGLNSTAIFSKKLYFAEMPSSDTEWSGIGIFNPGNERASILLKCFDKNGDYVGEREIFLEPYCKFVSLGVDVLNSNSVYRMVLYSDKPVLGFYLFGDKEHSYLYGLEAMK